MAGGLTIEECPNNALLCLWTAFLFRCGMHSDKLFQLNLVDLQIKGATAVAVLCGIVGATCRRAAPTVILV